MEDTLEGLQERMGLLDSTLEQHCDSMRDRLQEHSAFQVQYCRTTSLILIKLTEYEASFLVIRKLAFLSVNIVSVVLARMN